MEIEKLRRLCYLSTVPTHSPDSLKELHQLVREAVVDEFVANSELEGCLGLEEELGGPCNNCVNLEKCNLSLNLAEKCLPRYKNFELRMEGD